jgi:hypothetical protein
MNAYLLGQFVFEIVDRGFEDIEQLITAKNILHMTNTPSQTTGAVRDDREDAQASGRRPGDPAEGKNTWQVYEVEMTRGDACFVIGVAFERSNFKGKLTLSSTEHLSSLSS